MKKYLKVKDVADTLGLCDETVRRLSDEGKLPCVRNIRNYRIFRREDVAKFEQEYVKKGD